MRGKTPRCAVRAKISKSRILIRASNCRKAEASDTNFQIEFPSLLLATLLPENPNRRGFKRVACAYRVVAFSLTRRVVSTVLRRLTPTFQKLRKPRNFISLLYVTRTEGIAFASTRTQIVVRLNWSIVETVALWKRIWTNVNTYVNVRASAGRLGREAGKILMYNRRYLPD